MTEEQPTFLLVHSPLVGPSTWAGVAAALERHGADAVVPSLAEPEPGQPYAPTHIRSAVAALPLDTRAVILVGHSGAGALLPGIAGAVEGIVRALIYVDAGLPPADGDTRLDAMAVEDGVLADELRQHLEAGGTFPAWDDETLAGEVPDPDMRATLIREIRRRGLDYWVEPMPVPTDWAIQAAGYLLMSAGYVGSADRAADLGWPVIREEWSHFALLTRPAEVAAHLRQLVLALEGRT
jgi:hypothetical protein